METYCIKFVGRKVGAIGIFERHVRNVEAENVRDAVLKVYDTHEHLSDIWVNDIKLEHWETTNTNETKHTATPWHFEQSLNQNGMPIPYNWHVLAPTKPAPGVDEAWFLVAETSTQANAAFIVEAVNAHDKLKRDRDALRKALKLAQATIERLTVRHGPFSSTDGTQSVIRAAIAQAEGKE